MWRSIFKRLKKLPIDFGQYEQRYTSKGKLIAYELAGDGSGKAALDLGCRDGYWSERLVQKGYQVTSVDVAPQYSKAIALDANREFPFPNESFDLVWCSEVIEHLKDPAFSIAQMKRVLKPRGSLVMTTPNREFWFYRLCEGLGISAMEIQNEEHTCFLSFSEMKELLGDCDEYGFFAYFLFKRAIIRYAPLLSPTIVAHYRKP